MLALALTLRIPQSRPSLRIVTLPLLKVPADEAERFASMVSVRDKIQQLQQDLGRVWSTLGAIRASDATPPGLALALTLTPTVPPDNPDRNPNPGPDGSGDRMAAISIRIEASGDNYDAQ